MTERIAILFDTIQADELVGVSVKPDSRSVSLFSYLTTSISAVSPGAVTKLFIAAPSPGKSTTKELREHAPKVQEAIAQFDPTVVAVLGKSALYAVEPWLPGDFPKSSRYQRLWGKYFPGNIAGRGVQTGRARIVCCPSPAMVWAGKSQEGGYLYLRTIQENITGCVLRTTDPISTVSHLIDDRDRLLAITGQWTEPAGKLARIVQKAVIAVDTETTGLNIVTDRVRTVQLSAKDGEAYVVPFELLSPDDWIELFDKLRNAGYTLVLQNGKYDSKILRSNGVSLGDYDELSVAHVLLDEREGTHNLDFIGQQVLGAGKSEITKEQLVNGPIDTQFVLYAGRDTDITRRAFRILSPLVRDKPAYQTLNKSARLLSKGEHYGIKLDQELLRSLNEQADRKLVEYQSMFDRLGLNPSSPLQVKKMLGMDGKSDKLALAELDTELSNAIIDYRGLMKVKQTYLSRLQASANVDGRFHPDIRLAGPVTGRTSSGSGTAESHQLWLPINSQNIPRPAMGQSFRFLSEELRSQLRYLFVADEGRVMLGMDLAAAEMRMAANACMDPVMIDDLNRKVDTHALLTIMAKNLPYEIDLDNPGPWVQAVKENYANDRQSTKNATFATLYGGGISAIALQAKCDTATAALLRRTIYSRYKGLERWISSVHNQIRSTGRIGTRYGRQRIFPYSTGVFDNQQQQSMLREGQNYVIQSEASDYCLMGLVKFMEVLPPWFSPVYVQNMVHDALYFSVAEEDAEEAKKILVEAVETADDLPAKMYADAKFAKTWGDL